MKKYTLKNGINAIIKRNNNTPRILVQLRSIGLWTLGENELLTYSYGIITEILQRYDIEVNYCQENRIDYCYHTNAIQNPLKTLPFISSFRNIE